MKNYNHRFSGKQNNYSDRNRSSKGFSSGRSGRRRFKQTIRVEDLIQEAENVQEDIYTARFSFEDFNIQHDLKKNILSKGYTTPTPIQDQTIPAILDGRDVIGIANTGTGKTAAFLIPLIHKVLLNRNEKILIVAPTRELAMQIREELFSFTRGMGIYSVLCIGGTKRGKQKQELSRSFNFVIGTPGRIKDFVNERVLQLERFSNVVLDEVDLMVDIGFIHDITFIISKLSSQRQSLFFSATVTPKVEKVLTSFVRNPITVSVKQQETSRNVEQNIVRVKDRKKKIEQLHDLLIQDDFKKVLIFGSTKWGVQKLSDELVKRGFAAGAIHGNKNQSQRQRTLNNFKQNEISILLATDVAARGLDINNVTHVINYDMPASYDDYVHRIGRTGRADRKGIALTFVD